ncbi:hypothetical protein M569_04858, partial [Genlisea aurea]
AVNQLGDANEVLNERAVIVMERMRNKLTGRDFSTSPVPSVPNSPDHSNLIYGDNREAEHGLSVKLQVVSILVKFHHAPLLVHEIAEDLFLILLDLRTGVMISSSLLACK